jgi:hypothetical protein
MHRTHRGLVSRVALFAFATSLALPLLSSRHAWADDPDAGWGGVPIVLAHEEAQVEGAVPADAGRHCAICHWMRALSNSVTSSKPEGPGLIGALSHRLDRADPVATTPAESGPARAPPTSLG